MHVVSDLIRYKNKGIAFNKKLDIRGNIYITCMMDPATDIDSMLANLTSLSVVVHNIEHSIEDEREI